MVRVVLNPALSMRRPLALGKVNCRVASGKGLLVVVMGTVNVLVIVSLQRLVCTKVVVCKKVVSLHLVALVGHLVPRMVLPPLP